MARSPCCRHIRFAIWRRPTPAHKDGQGHWIHTFKAGEWLGFASVGLMSGSVPDGCFTTVVVIYSSSQHRCSCAVGEAAASTSLSEQRAACCWACWQLFSHRKVHNLKPNTGWLPAGTGGRVSRDSPHAPGCRESCMGSRLGVGVHICPCHLARSPSS